VQTSESCPLMVGVGTEGLAVTTNGADVADPP